LEPEAMRVEELAGDVVAIADELGLERFALWGHSAGAYRAYAVAVAEPSRVTAVVGHGGPPPLSEPEWGEWRDQEFADSIRAGNDVVDLVRQNFPDEFPVRLEEELRSADPETLACLIERHLGERFQASWLKLKPPRLLLLGEEETTPEWVERARSALSNTDIAVLPNLGHISGFLASDEAVQAVRPFLARVEAEASAGTGQIHR
jgi:pimeloyl-ACP methyl ester carboxylesterase